MNIQATSTVQAIRNFFAPAQKPPAAAADKPAASNLGKDTVSLTYLRSDRPQVLTAGPNTSRGLNATLLMIGTFSIAALLAGAAGSGGNAARAITGVAVAGGAALLAANALQGQVKPQTN